MIKIIFFVKNKETFILRDKIMHKEQKQPTEIKYTFYEDYAISSLWQREINDYYKAPLVLYYTSEGVFDEALQNIYRYELIEKKTSMNIISALNAKKIVKAFGPVSTENFESFLQYLKRTECFSLRQ